MNKYELKYQLEQMTSAVDRLTDTLGKQSQHISDLWQEIGDKNRMNINQKIEIIRLKDKVDRYRRRFYQDGVKKAEVEKDLREYMGESTDN
jgi:regulator of replication initiation timing